MTDLVNRIPRWHPAQLTGPIFGKELRCFSRRKRNYLIRFAYLALLTLYLLIAWVQIVHSMGYYTASFRAAQMAQIGWHVCSDILAFQLCLLQLMSVLFLGTCVSDEKSNRTLGTLLATPITGSQIILGKFFGGCVQLMVLVAVSLPLLAIVRLFGGVVWEYLIAAFCIIITTLLFTGALSLFISVTSHSSEKSLLKCLIILILLYAVLPILGRVIGLIQPDLESYISKFLALLSPHEARTYLNSDSYAMGMKGSSQFFWGWHCLIHTVGTLVFLGLAMIYTRKYDHILTYDAGFVAPVSSLKNWIRRRKSERLSVRSIEPVRGSPVLWMEFQKDMLPGLRTSHAIVIGACILGALYALVIVFQSWRNIMQEIQYECFLVLAGISIIRTGMLATASIAGERERRTLPVLLMIPISNRQIIQAKAIGVFRRCWLFWFFLAGCLPVIFIDGEEFMNYLAVSTLLEIPPVMLCMTGLGIYFSVRMRSTLAALIALSACVFFDWFLLSQLKYLFFLLLYSAAQGAFFDWLNYYSFITIFDIVIYLLVGVLSFWGAIRGLRRYAM